jgi:hypothetical protein
MSILPFIFLTTAAATAALVTRCASRKHPSTRTHPHPHNHPGAAPRHLNPRKRWGAPWDGDGLGGARGPGASQQLRGLSGGRAPPRTALPCAGHQLQSLTPAPRSHASSLAGRARSRGNSEGFPFCPPAEAGWRARGSLWPSCCSRSDRARGRRRLSRRGAGARGAGRGAHRRTARGEARRTPLHPRASPPPSPGPAGVAAAPRAGGGRRGAPAGHEQRRVGAAGGAAPRGCGGGRPGIAAGRAECQGGPPPGQGRPPRRPGPGVGGGLAQRLCQRRGGAVAGGWPELCGARHAGGGRQRRGRGRGGRRRKGQGARRARRRRRR